MITLSVGDLEAELPFRSKIAPSMPIFSALIKGQPYGDLIAFEK